MSCNRQEPIWPFLGVLLCLFILSATAPRTWETTPEVGRLNHARVSGGDDQPEPLAFFTPAHVAPKYAGIPVHSEWCDLQLPDPVYNPSAQEQVAQPGLFIRDSGRTGSLPVFSRHRLEACATALMNNPGQETLAAESSPPAVAHQRSEKDQLAGQDWFSEEDRPGGEIRPTDQPQLPEPSVPNPLLVDDRDLGAVEGITVVPAEDFASKVPPRDLSGWDGKGAVGRPDALFQQLDGLAWNCQTGPWARATARRVRKLGCALAEGSGEAISIIGRLEGSAAEADRLADQLEEQALADGLHHARHAIERRLPMWRQVAAAGGPSAIAAGLPEVDSAQLLSCLAAIDKLAGDSAGGRCWRQFLATDLLATMATASGDEHPQQSRSLALEILQRLNSRELTAGQRRFVTSGPVAELESDLRRWISGPVCFGELMQRVEGYELEGRASVARRLADDLLRLEVSPVAGDRAVSHQLQTYYRNANLRISIAEDLINRVIPAEQPRHEMVRDQVLGRPVRGQSSTSVGVALRMVPDESHLLMDLEIRGLVSSSTSSSRWPATFHNQSQSTYTALKPIELNATGLHLRDTDISVTSETRLQAVETDLDFLPLIGPLVQGFVRSEEEKSRCEIRREVQQKVQSRAQRQIDDETETRLGSLANRLTQRVLEPLAAMKMGPTMVRARTTDSRMTMELRLAANGQLGGHTDRPWAPSDSLVSCQIHQSAFNNFIESMQLDGGTFTLAELRRRLAEKIHRPELAEVATERDDVSISFATRDALRVRLSKGRIELTLAILKLRKTPREWRNFQIIVGYRPEVDGRRASLVRDGVVQLIGRMNYRTQIPLRAIFSKTFPKGRRISAVPELLATDSRMDGLAITQFVIDDGWISVAVGPDRRADRSALAGRSPDQVE